MKNALPVVNHADLFAWGSWDEVERRVRIKLSLWAYAYEIRDKPMVSDARYDMTAKLSDPSIRTGRYDEWWKANFDPSTGLWVHKHPDLKGLARLYDRLMNC